MSSTIDQRVVEMQFDNQRFERNVSTSISTLDKLKQALKLDSASQGIDSIEKGFSKLNLSGVGSAVDTIANRFSTLGVIGTTILQDIGHRAFQAGQQILGMIKSMTVSQIGSGWDKYAEKTTSVQTVMKATEKTWENDANTIMQLNAMVEKGFEPDNARSYLQTWKEVNNGIINTWQAAQKLGISVQDFNERTKELGSISSLGYIGSQMDYVNSQMNKLNWFTDETSYNFTDMVNNIGKFTANNIPLSEAVTSMQGIATWAAKSGQNASTASRVMYNMAQAIGAGSIKLMDWRSVETANMATAEFKEEAIKAAAASGKLRVSVDRMGKSIYKTTNGMEVTVENFAQTLSTGWFDKNILISTLDKYGAFTNKLYEFSEASGLTATEILQLIDAEASGSITQKEYSQVMADTGLTIDEVKKSLGELASKEYEFGRKAFEASQEAKTFQEAVDSVKEAASTKWMNIFENIFGDYEKAKRLWTGFSEFLYSALVEPLEKIEDLSSVLGELNAVNRIARGFGYIFSFLKGDGVDSYGVFDSLYKGITRIFKPVQNIKLEISKVLTAFTRWGKSIQLTSEQAFFLRRAASGLARVLKIGVIDSFVNLWNATEPLRASLAKIASSLTTLFLKLGVAGNGMELASLSGDLLFSVCEKIAEVLNKLSDAIDRIKISDLRSKFSKLFGIISKVKNAFTDFSSILDNFSLSDSLMHIFDFIKNVFSRIKDFVLGTNWSTVFKIAFGGIATAFIAYKGYIIHWLLTPLKNLSEMVGEFADQLWTMNLERLSSTIRNIAIAIGILAAALLVLSYVDYGKATEGLLLIAGIMGFVYFALLQMKAIDYSSIFKLAGLSTSLLIISVAFLVFSSSLIVLAGAIALFALVAKLDTIWTGLGVMAVSLGILCAALFVLSKLSPKVIISSLSLLMLSTSLILLAGAMAAFALIANMDNAWKGLGLMAASLGILVVALLALSYISPLVIVGAVSILVLSSALIVLAGALALFSAISSMSTAWTGVALLATSLLLLVTTLIVLGAAGPSILIGAAAILVLSAALIGLAASLALFAFVAGLDSAWAGLGMLAITVGVLTIALLALAPAALGVLGVAAALLVMSAACLVFAIAIGVVGVALPLLGTGLAALAAGVGDGLESLATGITSFGAGIGGLIASVMEGIALGVEALVASVGNGIADGINAISDSISNFSTGLSDVGSGITAFGDGIRTLDGISWTKTALGIGEISLALKNLKVDNLGSDLASAANGVVTSCTSMVTSLSTAIEQAGTFAKTGGAKIVVNFASGIKSKSGSARSAGTSISNAAVQGMSSSSGYTIGQQAAQGFINGFLSKELTAGEAGKRIARMAYEKAKAELGIHSPSRVFFAIGDYATQGFINGLLSLQDGVGNASESISQTAISSVVDTMASISDMMDANPEFTPTIRPVLDSTSLTAGLKMVKSLNSDTSVTTTLSARDLSELQNGRALLANALSNVNSSTEHAESIKFTPKDAEEFIAIGNKIIDYLKDGHDLYFDDGAFAGRIDRRLGAI